MERSTAMPPSAPSPASFPLLPGLRPDMPSILREITAKRQEQLARAQAGMSESALQRAAAGQTRRNFEAALRPSRPGLAGPAVIAELKRRSPSRGRLREDFDIPLLAAGYAGAGAATLSVLTEEAHFEGRMSYLGEARHATRLPLLCKDFIFSSYQIWEAAAAGADAVLLIAALLDDALMGELFELARRAELTALCEVHTMEEMQRVAALGATCVGVNNRDLHTFHVDVERAMALAAALPAGAVGVAESGLVTRGDLDRMAAAGYHAVLMGEAFMRTPSPGRSLARLRGGTVKICGITRIGDARTAVEAGADAIGFVFAASSPRSVSPDVAQAIVNELPARVLRVGVFAGADAAEILAVAAQCGLDRVQLHGAYAPAVGAALAKTIPVWRACGVPIDEADLRAWAPVAERILLDTSVGGRTGGNGVAFDWDVVPCLARRCPGTRFMVAGGLNPGNVAEAIRRADCFAVDTASGVEAEPGRKDAAAMARFVTNARSAFQCL